MKITNKFVIGLIGLLLLLAYGHALHFPFQFDDYNVIVDEPKVHSLSAWWQSMPGIRPLLKLSYALNWQLEPAPHIFRAFNLGFHFVTSILVWRICVELLPILRKSVINNREIALLTAILFALHPAHSEVVTYISSRSTGLMTMFCVASIFYWIKFNQTNLKNRIYLNASLLFGLFAVLTKEPAVILPLIAGLIAWFCFPQYWSTVALRSKLHYILALMLVVAYLLLMPQYQRVMSHAMEYSNLKNQFILQPIAHIHYLTQTLFGLNLNVDYVVETPEIFFSFLYLAVLFLLIFSAFKFKNQYRLFSFSVLWWFIWLLPSNSILPRPDLINDRQIYMASIAPVVLISAGVVSFSVQLRKFKLAWMTPATLILLIFSATWLRNWDYESEVMLWQSSLRRQANNSRAWNNLGYAYLQANKKIEAKNAFENALKLDENNYKALANLKSMNTQ
jgi:protein O-mannosyl-transferase